MLISAGSAKEFALNNAHFFANGVSSFLMVVGLGLLFLKSARSHAWLFQFHDAKKGFHNWVEFLAPKMSLVSHQQYRAFVHLCLGRSGSSNRSVNHFLASQFLAGVVAFSASYLLFVYIWGMTWLIPFSALALGLLLPPLSLREASAKRLKHIHRDLPFFLDYMSLSLVAGLDFSGALKATVENVAPPALKEELSRIQSNMLLGMSREQALVDFEDRLASETIRGLVQTLVSSLKLGTDLSNTLQTLSSSLSTKRFQMAEEEAGKISVRMMVPMICFILPVVLLIMIGPMFLSFINSGM